MALQLFFAPFLSYLALSLKYHCYSQVMDYLGMGVMVDMAVIISAVVATAITITVDKLVNRKHFHHVIIYPTRIMNKFR